MLSVSWRCASTLWDSTIISHSLAAIFPRLHGLLFLVQLVAKAAYYSFQTAHVLLRPAAGPSNCLYLHFVFQWCPPCRALLPELRKASKHLYGQLKFGTLDCTVHEGLCNMVSCRNLYLIVFFFLCVCNNTLFMCSKNLGSFSMFEFA